MKIAIPTVGSRGDVQPHIALAQGLKRAGHTVTLLSHPSMRILVEEHGIDFLPIGLDIDVGQEVAAVNMRSRNIIMGLIRAARFVFEKLEQCHDDILAGCKGADLIVTSASTGTGMNEAELLKLPYASMNFMPWIIPIHDSSAPLSQKLLYTGMNWLIGLLMRRPFNRIRRRHGLKPIGSEGMTSAQLDIIPISPHVFAPNPHWKSNHQTSGYWFVDHPEIWQPSDDLLTFLEDGDPPIVVSMGSISLGSQHDTETARLFVDTIQRLGIRAIIQSWSADLAQLNLPANIYAAGSIPHNWLLSRVSGIVHHGGFGTTAAGFRAGIPTLIIPHIADQFFWGQHVKRLGVGVQHIARSKLNASKLADALQELVHSDPLRKSASELGEKIRDETGIENAVRMIEETFH